MLVGIAPVGDRAYFFKVVGPIAAVDRHANEIIKFMEGVRVGPGHPPADWKMPDGWNFKIGSGMRVATVTINTDEKPLELAITTLPWRGTPEELLSNINRWRGQLKLPEAGQDQLAEFTRETKVGDATMTIVDLRGRFDAGAAMTPPFAGAVGAASRAAQGNDPQLPAGHPPIEGVDSQPNAPTPSRAGIPKFDPPTHWQALPTGGMRKAAFQVGDQQKGAVVTLIDFPTDAGPMISDPLQNVNRWRREVGLADIEQKQLKDSVEEIEIDGQPARYVRLIPDAANADESKADRATLGAMVTSGNRVWFIKMTGASDVVANQEGEFKNFVKTIRFAM